MAEKKSLLFISFPGKETEPSSSLLSSAFGASASRGRSRCRRCFPERTMDETTPKFSLLDVCKNPLTANAWHEMYSQQTNHRRCMVCTGGLAVCVVVENFQCGNTNTLEIDMYLRTIFAFRHHFNNSVAVHF